MNVGCGIGVLRAAAFPTAETGRVYFLIDARRLASRRSYIYCAELVISPRPSRGGGHTPAPPARRGGPGRRQNGAQRRLRNNDAPRLKSLARGSTPNTSYPRLPYLLTRETHLVKIIQHSYTATTTYNITSVRPLSGGVPRRTGGVMHQRDAHGKGGIEGSPGPGRL